MTGINPISFMAQKGYSGVNAIMQGVGQPQQPFAGEPQSIAPVGAVSKQGNNNNNPFVAQLNALDMKQPVIAGHEYLGNKFIATA